MITFRDAPPTLPVPNVVRLTASAARTVLAEAGLQAVFVRGDHTIGDVAQNAIVQVQVPSVGQLASPGAGIALYVT